MRRPLATALASGAAVVALALLSGCGLGSGGTATPSASGTPAKSGTPSPSATPTTPPLPDGVLAEVRATAKQQGGQELTLRMTVREQVDWNSTDGAPIAARIAQTCAGELDSTVFAQDDYRFVRIDVTATAASGDWDGGAVAVLPAPLENGGYGVVASGSATQIAVLGPNPEPGDYVPHCAQPAVITGAGTGEVDLAFPQATPAVWASLAFGFAVAPTSDGSAPLPLVFGACTVQGATGVGADWVKSSSSDGANACAIQAT
jgi:hypothetical protein